MSLTEMVETYNVAQDLLGRTADSHVKKFRDVTAGQRRVQKALDELRDMYGYAEMSRSDQGLVTISVTRPLPKPQPKPQPGEPRRSTTTLPLSSRLEILARANPKIPRTRAWDTYELYLSLPDDATGEDFVSSMITRGYPRKLALSSLHWDIAHGYVRLRAMSDA
jgi:hypothetical protein